MRVSYTWQIGNIQVIPTLMAAWKHEYFYSAMPVVARVVIRPQPMTRERSTLLRRNPS
ncbi:MAG: hypothetical protein JOZ21_09200 [Verrucomicrobia bacterium]|nr:hypothetical protein [Verrucomicrobiota bacterium]